MKKLLLFIGLIFQPITSAAPVLYSVTVNIKPATARATVVMAATKDNPNGCSQELAPLKCRLPAGKYHLFVWPADEDYSFERLSLDITISKNTIITKTVKMSSSGPTISMSTKDSAVFNAIAIKNNAEIIECKGGKYPILCATSPFSIQAVRTLINLDKNVQQTRAWEKAGNSSLGNFTTNKGGIYQMILTPTSNDGTFIQFIAY